jgi:hypothetical protein
MTPKRILIALLLLMVLVGVIEAPYESAGREPPIGWSLAVTLAFSFLCFAWYRQDSDLRHYKRSRWLNSGMVVLTVVAMPYYLLRSRPRGQKLRALFRCLGFSVLLFLATATGMVLSGHAV